MKLCEAISRPALHEKAFLHVQREVSSISNIYVRKHSQLYLTASELFHNELHWEALTLTLCGVRELEALKPVSKQSFNSHNIKVQYILSVFVWN